MERDSQGWFHQGSVLDPLLFNIFIKGLFFCVENSDVCNHADDIYLSRCLYRQYLNKLESDINISDTWYNNNNNNNMLLNGGKCQFMIIEPSGEF